MARAVRGVRDSTRLDEGAWILAGLAELAEHGIGGVKVEALAKRMKVTKGSFYWHFRDRDAFLEAILSDWRRRATIDVIDRLERSEGGALERLRRLMRLPIVGRSSEWGADVELGIRLWGRSDVRARSALREVDEIRLRYIRRLMEATGVDAAESEARAILAYSYMRVAATLIGEDQPALLLKCEMILFGPGHRGD